MYILRGLIKRMSPSSRPAHFQIYDVMKHENKEEEEEEEEEEPWLWLSTVFLAFLF